MIGLHIRYEPSLSGGTTTVRLESYCFDNENWKPGHNKQADEGKVYILKCNECQSNNWSDNGREINELECDSCGQFVKIQAMNESPEAQSND